MFRKKTYEPLKVNNKVKRKRWIKWLCRLALVAFLAVWLMLAFNIGIGMDINRALGLRGASPSSKHDLKANIRKSETVYVDTHPNGTPNTVVVDAKLKNNPESKKIVDRTCLTDLYNINGGEEYKDNRDGTVTWDTPKGEDIFYEGNAKPENLPVTMTVKYYLNGKRIGGRALQGKSGKLKIVISYTNNVTEKVNGKKTVVPFVCMAAMLVTDESFKNITVTPGKVLKEGNKKTVMGVAMPGVSKSIKSNIMKEGIGDTVVIEGTASNFSGNEIATLVSSDVLKVVSNKKLSKLDADKKIYKLDVSTKKLVKGSKQLSDGVTLLNSKLPQLTDGIGQATAGAEKLSDAMSSAFKAMKAGTKLLKKGADVVLLMAQNEDKLLEKLQNDNGTGYLDRACYADKTSGVYIRCMKVIFDTTTYPTAEAASLYIKATYGVDIEKEKIQEIRDFYAGRSGTNPLDPAQFAQLPEDKNTYGSGEANAAGAEKVLTDSLSASTDIIQFIRYIHAGTLVKDTDGNIDEAATRKATEKADVLLKLYMTDYLDDISKLKTTDEAGTEYYLGFTGLIENVDSGLGELLDGIDRASAKKNSLTSGAAALAKGMRKIDKGTGKLTKGVNKLDKGSVKLSKGMSKYYTEGISKIVKMYNSNLKGVSAALKRLKAAGAQYDNYSGITGDMDGSVTFMYFTPMGDY